MASSSLVGRSSFTILLNGKALITRVKTLFPGMLITLTIAAAAHFLSEHYGAPVMLMALLLGMAFNFLNEEQKCVAGIQFTSKTVLRFGVALLGLGITLDQIRSFGFEVIELVGLSVCFTILCGIFIAIVLGRHWSFGVLTGGAVGICGASAALAISSVLPKTESSERNTVFTVMAVTSLSTIAMVVYPLLAKFLELDPKIAGILLGATIHDVAQVVGAGYSMSDQTGDAATFVKLLRVAMLIPFVLALTFVIRKRSKRSASIGQEKVTFPYFVLGFAALVVIGNLHVIPMVVKSALLVLSKWCLVVAIAAFGIKTSPKMLMKVGGQAILIVCLETLFLLLFVLGSLTVFK